PDLQALVGPIWSLLPERPEAAKIAVPDITELNYFDFDERWLSRRIEALSTVVDALNQTALGNAPTKKVSSTRYGAGLLSVPPTALARFSGEPSEYLRAVSLTA